MASGAAAALASAWPPAHPLPRLSPGVFSAMLGTCPGRGCPCCAQRSVPAVPLPTSQYPEADEGLGCGKWGISHRRAPGTCVCPRQGTGHGHTKGAQLDLSITQPTPTSPPPLSPHHPYLTSIPTSPPPLPHLHPYLTFTPTSPPPLCRLHPYFASTSTSPPPLPRLPPYLASLSTSAPLVCPAAAHCLLRVLASGCRCLTVLSPLANMLLSPLVPQNQCR